MNRVILEGFLGKDPEVRFTAAGMAVANLSLATNEMRGSKEARTKHTEWHRIVAFGKQAEMASEHYKKGKQVLIEGRIQTRDWEDKNGIKRYSTEVVASYMRLLGKGDGESSGGHSQTPPIDAYDDSAVPEYIDDDIPF